MPQCNDTAYGSRVRGDDTGERHDMNVNAAAVLTKPAFRKIEWLERDIAVERRPDGVIVMQVADSAEGLREAHPGLIGEMGGGEGRTESGWRNARAPTGSGASCRLPRRNVPSTH